MSEKKEKTNKLRKDTQRNLERHRQDSNFKGKERHDQTTRPKHDEKALLREQGWSGRSGGLDISLSQSWEGSSNISQKVKGRKKEHTMKQSCDADSDRPKSADAMPSTKPYNGSTNKPTDVMKNVKSSTISSKTSLSPFILS